MVFTTLCFAQLGNTLSVRSVYHSILCKHIFANKQMWAAIIYVPFLQTILKTSYLEWKAMASILIVTARGVICI